MAAGLVLMDVVWAIGLLGLAWVAVTAGWAIAGAIDGALGVTLGLGGAVLAWIGTCALVLALLPKPRPGTHRLMRGADFYGWVFGFVARRWLELPPFGLLMRQSAVLRFIVLRAAGARVAFSAQVSSDAVLMDPPLLVVERGAMIGSQATIAGHFILGDRLHLAPVVIRAEAQVALDVVVGPGTTIGPRARVEARASIGPGCDIGAEAHIAGGASLGRGVKVEPRARVPLCGVVPAGTVVRVEVEPASPT